MTKKFLVYLYTILFICIFINLSLLLLSPLKAHEEQLLFLGNHDIPPMIYQTQAGPKGLVIDLAREIIEKAKIHAKIDAIDWATAQEKLKTGSADALLQINPNPEREKIFDFSKPLLKSEFSIFRRSDRIDIQNIESLYGRTVGVEKKGYPLSLLKKHSKINIVIIPSWAQGFQDISKGKIDAILVDRWVGEFELSKLKLTNIVVNETPVESSYSAIAVKKGNKVLLDKINASITAIKADGSYQRILDNWKNHEVIYLTRGQHFNYIISFILILFVLIIITGLIYVRRIRYDNQLKSELNQRLENRNDELLQFAYRTSHDLKAPLTSSKQFLRFIAKDIETGDLDEAKRNVKTVENQMVKLERLVISVLDMASAEFKEQEYERINFLEMLEEIQERLTLSLDEKTCEVTLSDNTTGEIYLPKTRLTQIIENIVANGIKYRDKSKSNAFVKVSTSNNADSLIIIIEDNGLGVPEEYQHKIYDMFQRFHPEIEGGSGLGLNIVRKHVEVLEGTIRFTSIEKQGTRFEIKIPYKAK